MDKIENAESKIDYDDVSPASIPHNPHGILLDFKFTNNGINDLVISKLIQHKS